MSNVILHHDLATDAAAQREREAARHVHEKTVRHHASRAAARRRGPGVRVRLIQLMARAMGVAGEIATTSTSRPSEAAHKPQH